MKTEFTMLNYFQLCAKGSQIAHPLGTILIHTETLYSGEILLAFRALFQMIFNSSLES